MSEDIIFADMLNHYSLKSSEISDMLSTMVEYLNKCVMICRDSWESDASEKFIESISFLHKHISDANISLDELLKQFNALKNNELDTQLNELDAELSDAINN